MNFRGFIRLVLPAAAAVWAASALAADPPPLSAYGELPGVEAMTVSPSGAAFAIAGRVEAGRWILVFDAGRQLRASASLGDGKLYSIRWAGEDSVLGVMRATANLGPGFTTSKYEAYGSLILPVNGGRKTEWVFSNREWLANAIFGDYGVRLVDGKWLGYFGGLELVATGDRMGYMFDHNRPALFAVDLAENKPRKIAPSASDGFFRRWLVDGDGAVAATLDRNYDDGGWRITNRRGATIASGKDPTGDIGLVSLGRDGSTLIYSVEDDESGKTRWMEVPLAGGAAKEVLADIDIDRTYVDPQNGRMLGYLEGGADPRPVLFDPARQAVVDKIYRAFARREVRIVEWTPTFGHFIVHTSGNGDSGTWYLVDVAGLKADPLGYDYPLIGADRVGAISTFAYKAADGLDLDGILTLPPGREPRDLPVVMLPHGGPNDHDEATFHWWAQAFASRGYAVFQPNFRGSTNRDDAFRRAGNGQWGRKMQSDISDGLAALARQGIVDPRRACIVGASYGGYAALAGVTLQQGLYRCAVAVAPVSDLTDMYWTDYRESGGNKMLKRSLNESLGSPAGFAAVSPRRQAARADAPILLIHGKDDTVVPFKQSSAMADALKDNGKPYELVVLREEDHWLSHAVTRKQMLEAAVAFVQRNNPAN